MPTYDYECDACNHKFELYQSIMADPEKKCPSCKKQKLRRLLGTGGAVVFKGSGFYQTDYRSESYKKSAASESKSSESKSTDSKSESKSESKTSETKSESSASTSAASDSSTAKSSEPKSPPSTDSKRKKKPD